MSQKFKVESKRNINTYAYMYKSANHSLKCGIEEVEGSFYQFMSSLMFSAFTLEAYMNHLGSERIEYWEEIQSIRYLDKLKILYLNLGIEFDKSKRPLQTVIQLVKFRNLMAHGKSESISGSIITDTPSRDPSVKVVETDWEKFCNVKEAQRVIEDIALIIESLNLASGGSKFGLWSLGNGSGSTTLQKP